MHKQIPFIKVQATAAVSTTDIYTQNAPYANATFIYGSPIALYANSHGSIYQINHHTHTLFYVCNVKKLVQFILHIARDLLRAFSRTCGKKNIFIP